MISKVQALYKKHERWVPLAFFVLGFLVDIILLGRIDELAVILQQAGYLLICSILIGVELIDENRAFNPPNWLRKVWLYRESALHFLLGSLLSNYTLFYFKSASALTSFVFIALLMALLIINEFKRFGKSQTRVHVAFLSLCVISYLVCLAPILLGFIGDIPFVCAVIGTLLFFWGFYRVLNRKAKLEYNYLRTHLIAPFVGIQIIFAGLYFAHVIPPVPLSVSYMGIYHDIKKSEGKYMLSYTRPRWKFWQHGDQTFLARPGDTIFCFVRIFSPTRFKDSLQVRWLYRDPRQGWISSDAIPIAIVGGRDEGYRGVTKKANYRPGQWRVQVETLDEREIGRINFTVEPDSSTEEREIRSDIQ